MSHPSQDRWSPGNALRAARGALTAAERIEYVRPTYDGARAVMWLRAAVARLEKACAKAPKRTYRLTPLVDVEGD